MMASVSGSRIVTAADVPGQNRYGIYATGKDQPALAEGKVLYVGEAVAVVFAETLKAAEEAAARVRVEYQPLPGVFTPQDALAPDAPVLKGADNVIFERCVR